MAGQVLQISAFSKNAPQSKPNWFQKTLKNMTGTTSALDRLRCEAEHEKLASLAILDTPMSIYVQHNYFNSLFTQTIRV